MVWALTPGSDQQIGGSYGNLVYAMKGILQSSVEVLHLLTERYSDIRSCTKMVLAIKCSRSFLMYLSGPEIDSTFMYEFHCACSALEVQRVNKGFPTSIADNVIDLFPKAVATPIAKAA